MSKNEVPQAFSVAEIDKYRYSYELPHHWDLRKQFLLLHGGTMPNQRLICLSQIFVNTECMGLSYPQEVMDLVKELSAKIEKPSVIVTEPESVQQVDEEEDDRHRKRSNYRGGFHQGEGYQEQWRGGQNNQQPQRQQPWHQPAYNNNYNQNASHNSGNHRQPGFQNYRHPAGNNYPRQPNYGGGGGGFTNNRFNGPRASGGYNQSRQSGPRSSYFQRRNN